MAIDNWDRTVYAALPDGGAIVRYDRAGKWYVEWPPEQNRKRVPVTVKQAAGVAEAFHQEDGAYVSRGRAGGLSFDSQYRKLEVDLARSKDPEAIRAEFRKLLEAGS